MFCLDTNIIIYALNRRRPNVWDRLSAELGAGSLLLVSSIVLFELDYGIAKSNRPAEARVLLDTFMEAGFERIAFNSEDASEAGEIRASLEKCGQPIGPFDYLIAAQARRRGAVLVTTNRKEFERVPGLMVADWAV